jgi:integron integrase
MDGVLGEPATKPARLLDRVRDAVRRRNYSYRTEEAYLHWIRRFIYFSGKRHPAEMGAAEVTAFLNYLAGERDVAAATQNQALSAVLFLYKDVLAQPLPWLDELERAKRPARLPTVLTQNEVGRLLAAMRGTKWLMASLLYGAGLRLTECLKLRVKDVDFEYRQIVVRDGKGAKDRVTMLPQSAIEPLKKQLACAKALHEADVASGHGEVDLPDALARKYPRAPCQPHPRGKGSGARGGDCQARELPYAAPLLRNASTGSGLRHPHRAGAPRACGRLDDHDLHARPQQGRARGDESAG